MAIVSGVCNSYKREILRGVHSENDEYRLALYGESASLSPETTKYSSAGEVMGQGYTAGGLKLSGFTVSGETSGCLDFDDVKIKEATITACGGLIYNASKGGKAVSVVEFDRPITSTNGPFEVFMPTIGETTSLVRIA